MDRAGLTFVLQLFILMTQLTGIGNKNETMCIVEDFRRDAFQALRAFAQEEQNWTGIHALEALVDLGEISLIEELLAALDSQAGTQGIRVGIYRVRARVSPVFEEWNDWKSKLEELYLDGGNSDRLQALESLCKLGAIPSHAVKEKAFQDLEAGNPLAEIYAAWALSLAHNLDGLSRLRAFLRSHDLEMRRKAAYILARFEPMNPEIFRDLSNAYDSESESKEAKLYMACAILRRNVASDRQESLLKFLEESLTSATSKQKLEIFQVLMQFWDINDITRNVRDLRRFEGDGKIGASLAILYVLKKEESLNSNTAE